MTRSARLLLLLACSALIGAAPFRYSQPIQAEPGWSVVELPDEALDALRPGLPDLRIEGPSGEVAYAEERELRSVAAGLPLTNVERAPGRETSALVDRGERPSPATALSVVIAGSEPFLKPVVVEASDDRATFREIARGSIFRTDSTLATTLRFAPNDRRFLRLRLDDRNGPAVSPTHVHVEQSPSPVAPRVLPLELARATAALTDADVYATRLPVQNLGLTALRFTIGEPAFSRRVRIYELIGFRDELTRRLIADGPIERGATGTEQLLVPLGDVSSRSLELEIERAGTSLGVTRVEALVRPTRIVFFAPDSGALRLSYGSTSAVAPKYDLLSAFQRGLPDHFAPATLGPRQQLAAEERPIAPPPRGAVLDVERWRRRQPIVLPAGATVAYLDLGSGVSRALHEVRIVDGQGRQVPYIVESNERVERRALTPAVASVPGKTSVTLKSIDPGEGVRAIELYATAPEYWSRSVTVTEAVSDQRGRTGRRQLGSARWERPPGTPPAPLRVDIGQPSTHELSVEIDDGDNPALALGPVNLELVRRRIDFVFEPGERLRLLSGNPEASAPRYEFALLSGAVLASPALAASLGAPEAVAAPAPAADSRWLWVAIAVAGALVVAVLLRTLREQHV